VSLAAMHVSFLNRNCCVGLEVGPTAYTGCGKK